MGKQLAKSISEFPIPESRSTEIQVIADIIALPETLIDAQSTISPEMFTDDRCKAAFVALRAMAKDGMVIDMPSAFGRIDRVLMQKAVIPMMQNTGSAVTALQHYATLKAFDVRRKVYFKAIELLTGACDASKTAVDLVGSASSMVEELRKEGDAQKGMQHISHALQELGDNLEELQVNREKGKVLRIPTGFRSMDFYTYGGFNVGNLVILAARPSVGKTAVMLQMAKAASIVGKNVNIFSLEMTNAELAQRFLLSESDELNPWKMARGEVEWTAFERASGILGSKPIYMNDSARTLEEITSRITMNSMAGKCDIAFIDYLGLIKLYARNGNLSQAIAECTGDLKALAKSCRIPIVLLCQLNRSSASEKRPPEMHDLRDSGGIEQDADIILMLERAPEDEDGRTVNMWLRKNRQGSAGNVKIEIVANETVTSFREKGEMPPPVWEGIDSNREFDESEVPF